MSIRVMLLWLMVAGVGLYAWRDWFRALCGLVVLAALLEHPQMPKNIMGIQGLNPWNLLCLSVALAWLSQRRGLGLRWDLPSPARGLLGVYLLVILVGFLRAALDRGLLEMSLGELVSEHLINTLKWTLPGLMLFDGCRTRSQLKWALGAIALSYVLLAIQIARAMPAQAAFDAAALEWSRLKIDRRVGLHAVDLSTMLAGGFWGLLALLVAWRGWWARLLTGTGAGLCLYGQALTGGRAGYLAWGGAGVLLCVVRWRRGLVLLPGAVLLLAVCFPAAADRMLRGFGVTGPGGDLGTNADVVTSGRSEFWPYIIREISEAPLIGHGTQGTARSGLTAFMMTRIEGGATWAHSAYLEWLVDHGVFGLVPVLLFYLLMLWHGGTCFAHSPDSLFRAAGGMALAAIIVQCIAGIGSQHFYPRIGNMPMWCSIFLMLRVHVESARVRCTRRDTRRQQAWAPLRAAAAGAMPLPRLGVR